MKNLGSFEKIYPINGESYEAKNKEYYNFIEYARIMAQE